MAYELLLNESDLVSRWIARQITDEPDLSGAVAFGAVRNGMLVGGIAFTEMRHPDMRVTVAGYGPWLSLRLLRTGFAYAFIDQDCRRITAMVKRTNKPSRKLVEKLGFKLEGVHRQSFADGGTLCSYGMLRTECKWLKEKNYG
ncbi:GNAT family N-acetyltransferase [Aureimonas fodinaquatilis]|uniref:GNAT family N-acetyltransferase n=1 Tax=Aureimonas fodinaquatilis TaxID=2565783 RepID=A0A5B0DW71_9HYPH|nr:GNAT family protein [Aureimonas fodinaquatilis]KAA0971077.1 GNAT family N-acetyltransferase [Aureimonas fodinaquatilis]